MMKHKRRYISLFLSLLLWAITASADQSTFLENVLIVSIDAFHPASLLSEAAPNIRNLMSKGNYTLQGQSTNPPKTLVAHAAIFTGLNPEESGLFSNQWQAGNPVIILPTVFDTAKRNGYRTAFFYSKEKLGFLVNDAIDVHQWAQDNAIDLAEAFIKTEGRHFVFLHISGLDYVGPEHGWLSPEYMEELKFIDEFMAPLLNTVESRKHFLIIITSDHGGHGREHGTNHPEDAKVWFIVHSDIVDTHNDQNAPYTVTDLKNKLDHIIVQQR